MTSHIVVYWPALSSSPIYLLGKWLLAWGTNPSSSNLIACQTSVCMTGGIPQADMEGLAVVIIDALTTREWVREDYVPHHEPGVRDLQTRSFRSMLLRV